MTIPPLKAVFFGGIALTFCLILGWIYNTSHLEDDFIVNSTLDLPTIILDPGHGGEDGGAVSAAGAVESHINLDIVLKLEQVLLLYGVQPVLLREHDISLHDADATSFSQKKSSDLRNRVKMVEEIQQGLLVTIHQNAYPQTQYSGAQVFYNPQAQELAVQLQTLLQETLDPNNNRASKPVDSGVYLMNQVTCPALLVECGFLSNPQEAALLENPEYQTKIACAIATALLRQNTVPT